MPTSLVDLEKQAMELPDFPYSSPSDAELTHAADLVFQDYDRRETQG